MLGHAMGTMRQVARKQKSARRKHQNNEACTVCEQSEHCLRDLGAPARSPERMLLFTLQDQVPLKSTHSKMAGPEWVVLIAGSTDAASRAVRPCNRYVTPATSRDLVSAAREAGPW